MNSGLIDFQAAFQTAFTYISRKSYIFIVVTKKATKSMRKKDFELFLISKKKNWLGLSNIDFLNVLGDEMTYTQKTDLIKTLQNVPQEETE